MVEELRRVITQRLSETPGLVALVISDKDGVPILQASTEHTPAVDVCLRYQFLSSNAIISESSKKVELQDMKKSLMCYSDKQVLNIVQGQVILSIIAKADANTGLMENFAKIMSPMVEDVSKTVLLG